MTETTGKDPVKDRVLIVVSGGLVQEVYCDRFHKVILIDYDNIKTGEDDAGVHPAIVSTEAVDRALKEAAAEVKKRKSTS